MRSLSNTSRVRAGVSRIRRWLPPTALAALLAAGGASSGVAREAATTQSVAATTQPNIVFILADDMRADQLSQLPAVMALGAQGVRFRNAAVSNPLCCPSRATILTGRYSHSTRVYTNIAGPTGGWAAFKASENSTIATWLRGAGYRTGLIGKYLNNYPNGAGAVTPPGWDRWFAFANTPGYFNYKIADNGVFRNFGSSAANYSTDVLGTQATNFITSTPATQPLFLYFAPYAPHDPHTPPPRYAGSAPVNGAWHTPNFNEADVSDKPAWVRALPLQDPVALDRIRARQVEMLRALDDAIRKVVSALESTGRIGNTLIVFTADNGMQWGSHRFRPKETPYRESVKVPLVVRYDPITSARAGTLVDKLAVNIDLAPTMAEVAGVAAPNVDGRSLVPLLRDPLAPWRSDFLIEHLKGNSPVPTFCGVVTARYKLVEYATGERELYDGATDPYELENRASDPGYDAVEATLHTRLLELCTPRPPGLTLTP